VPDNMQNFQVIEPDNADNLPNKSKHSGLQL